MLDRSSAADPTKIIDWNAIRDEYVMLGTTCTGLSKKYNIGRSTVYRIKFRDDWDGQRQKWQESVHAQASETIIKSQVEDRIRIYEATRRAADILIEQLMKACEDPSMLWRHVVQMEEESEDRTGNSSVRSKRRWAEGQVLEAPNGKNAADFAKAIKDLSFTARTLDGIMDAKDRAKIDLDRERLQLAARTAGMDDDREHESGIAIMPALDSSILDTALDDPGEIAVKAVEESDD